MKTENRLKRIKDVLLNILAIVIICWFVYYLIENRNSIKSILNISLFHILCISLGILFTWLLNSAQTFVLLRAEGVHIGFWENFIVLTASSALNYLPMRVGTLLRLRYLKAYHGLRYARSGSLFGVRVIILVCATGLFGFLGAIGIFISEGILSNELLIIFITLIVASIVGYFLPMPKFKNNKHFILRAWTDFSTGFEAMRAKPFITLQVMLLIVLQFIVMSWRLYLAFDAVQIHLSVWILFLLVPLTTLMTFVALTPGGLGLREGLMGYVTLVSGYDFNSGIFAGAVDRAVLLAVTFIVGPFCLFYIWVRMRKNQKTNLF